MNNQPKKIKARITEYNGGRYGRSGEYVAIIEPQYFKNGNMRKSDFRVVEVLEIRRKGYRANCCATHTESIAEVMEIIEN